MKHRKLFPALTAINQTVDCPDYCALTCPYGCYEYPDYSIPPPPSTPISARESYHTPPYMIIILALLTGFFFLVSCYLIIVKYCSRGNHFGTPPTQSNGPGEGEFGDENQGPPLDHHIWYISTVGLHPSIINAITVFKYKRGDHLIEGTDCSVCLSEFQEGDTLRLLPKCNHAFHIPCIDTWLRSHTTCPSCRAGVVSNTTVSTNSASNDQIAHSSSPNEDTMMENSENYGGLDNNSLTGGEICENRVGTEDEVELPQVDDERNEFDNSKEVVNSNAHGVFRVVIDLADNKINMEDEIQPLRRSISMDSSSSAAHISLAETSFCKVESQGNPAD